jgi:hypothetical protein
MAFTNRNICKNFEIASGVTKQQLPAFECTEILFSVPSGTTLTLYSESDSNTGFVVVGGTTFTYSGLTNASELSASTSSGKAYYRTKHYANYNLAVQM